MIEDFSARAVGWDKETWVSGPGLCVYRDRLPAGARLVGEESWFPQPESLLHLGLGRFEAGEFDDVWSAEPLYLRRSAAEEQWQRRGRTD